MLSPTEFYTPIFCMLSVHPLRVTEKATHGKKVGLYSWHSRMGTSITINIIPNVKCAPETTAKVVESLRGIAGLEPYAFFGWVHHGST